MGRGGERSFGSVRFCRVEEEQGNTAKIVEAHGKVEVVQADTTAEVRPEDVIICLY